MDVTEVANAVPAPTTASARSSLSQEDFFNIMISELTNQDPLEPMDNNQFLDQLTQLQNLEATTKLTEGIESLLLGQQIASGGVLIGQQVTGVAETGDIVSGLVENVTVQDQEVLLGIGEHRVLLSLVQQVSGPEPVVTEE